VFVLFFAKNLYICNFFLIACTQVRAAHAGRTYSTPERG